MLKRLKKFLRDHVYQVRHDWELKLQLQESVQKYFAADHGLEFFVIHNADDPRLDLLARDFPKQSRSFKRDINAGCVMLVLGDDDRTMGYFLVSDRDFYDRDEYRMTFCAGGGLVYAYNFYVDPIHRTKPIARVLLAEGFAWLKAKGHLELVAMCASTNRPLVRLYRQFKMLPSGRAIDSHKILHMRRPVWVEKRD